MQKSLEKWSDLSALPTPEGNKRREVGLEKRSPTTVQFGAKIRKPVKPKTMCQMDAAFQQGHLGTRGTHQGKHLL